MFFKVYEKRLKKIKGFGILWHIKLSILSQNSDLKLLNSMRFYLQSLSVLELEYLKILIDSEITYHESEIGEISTNLDEEKERWP